MCPTAAAYCEGGGEERGPECASNADCEALHGTADPYCVEQICVECMSNQHCGEPNAPTCSENYCE
jgi:hypothetical protein